MSELTELEKKLVEKARTVSQDKDFFLAVLNYADTEEDQQAIIDYIDKGQDVNEQNVTLLAVFLFNKGFVLCWRVLPVVSGCIEKNIGKNPVDCRCIRGVTLLWR